MPQFRRNLLSLCVAATLCGGLSSGAAAVGVGEIHVQSSLGAPLVAEVPISHLGDLDATQLKVQLASQSDYSTLGVEYNYLHTLLKIEPILKNGEGYLRITTREPISEPYLNFVLSLRWPQGQLVREFTVLLDPPAAPVANTAKPTSEATLPEVIRQESVAASPMGMPTHRARHHRVRGSVAQTGSGALPDSAASAPAAPATATGERYTVAPGDTLWRIAERMHVTNVPLPTVMQQIKALNADAFIGGDSDRLKAAVAITLPSAEQLASAADGGAVAEPRSEHRAAVRVAAAESASAPAPASTAAPAGSALVEENHALREQVSELTGNVAHLNESLAQSEQRLHQLETQLNGVLEQLQQQRETMASLSGKPAEVQTATVLPGTGSVINQVSASELKMPVQPHTPWWVHMLYWLGIGGAVTWAVREHFWPQRRLLAAAGAAPAMSEPLGNAPTLQRRAPAEVAARAAVPEQRVEVESSPAIHSVADLADLSLDLPDIESASMDEPVVPAKPAPQLLNSNEESIDPSITAGVFVAFGRFADAERLLRDGIARNAGRVDLKLQLLDVLMKSDQPGAFDDLAEEIEQEATTPEDLAELAVLRDSYRPRH